MIPGENFLRFACSQFQLLQQLCSIFRQFKVLWVILAIVVGKLSVLIRNRFHQSRLFSFNSLNECLKAVNFYFLCCNGTAKLVNFWVHVLNLWLAARIYLLASIFWFFALCLKLHFHLEESVVLGTYQRFHVLCCLLINIFDFFLQRVNLRNLCLELSRHLVKFRLKIFISCAGF